MLPLAQLLVGFALSGLIGVVAYRRGSLTRSGVAGAILTGTAIFGFGGFVPGLLLVAFFLSSTFLSHFKASRKQQFANTFQKDSRRDLGQALANGGWAAVLAIGLWLAGEGASPLPTQMVLLAAFVGAIATVTADTWATEIGVLSRAMPRLITNGRIVPAGTSGGVTVLGTATALAGGAFIGVVALVGALSWLLANQLVSTGTLTIPAGFALPWLVVVVASVSGLAGALFDSVLGATVQAVYFSEYDERQTEKRADSRGNPTRRVRGWGWLDNDWVNFLSSVFGSLVAGLLTLAFAWG